MSLWATLPEELLLKAVEFMDVPQLLDLLSLSHRFQSLAEIVLYKSVTIETETPTLPRMASFYDTISTRSDLAARVKTLVLILEYGDSSRHGFIPSDFHKTLTRDILCKLPNLERLSLRCPPPSLNLPNSDSVRLPFTLTHFRWHNHIKSDDVQLFGAFLESQASLEFLDIRWTFIRSLRLSERALPCLHTLLANDDTACNILAARRIPHLVVTIEDGTDTSIARPASSQHVRSLECSGEALRSVVAFATQFPNLECLSICFGSLTSGNIADISTEALNLLQSFNCKKVKYISITSEFFIGSQVVHNAPAVFQALPMLQALDIVKDNGKVIPRSQARPNTYLRYTRESSSHHLPEGIQPRVDAYGWDLWWQHRAIGFALDAHTGTHTRDI